MFGKFSLIAVCALSVAVISNDAFAAKHSTKKVVQPTGAAREAQFKKVVQDCQKQAHGIRSMSAEWGSHYGRTGWWCHSRG